MEIKKHSSSPPFFFGELKQGKGKLPSRLMYSQFVIRNHKFRFPFASVFLLLRPHPLSSGRLQKKNIFNLPSGMSSMPFPLPPLAVSGNYSNVRGPRGVLPFIRNASLLIFSRKPFSSIADTKKNVN